MSEEAILEVDAPASARVWVTQHSSLPSRAQTKEQRLATHGVSCPNCWPKEPKVITKWSLFHASKFKLVCYTVVDNQKGMFGPKTKSLKLYITAETSYRINSDTYWWSNQIHQKAQKRGLGALTLTEREINDQHTGMQRTHVLLNRMGPYSMHTRIGRDREGLSTRKRLGQGRKSLL